MAKVEAAAVSRRHACLVEKHGLFHCVDLGSRNGTFVNGRPSRETPVGPGDVIRCGDSVWMVSRRAPSGDFAGLRELAPAMFGGSTMAEALVPLQRLAKSAHSVILEGETGVGKELAARALHAWSGRVGKYVAVNCAALPESLAEGELFGYRKGAFTGADRSHAGIFRNAQDGTLLLDEICELPLKLQAKLLRVLEQREITPVGDTEPISLDVRIVAAAQRPLRDEVKAGRFREDLLTRLGMAVRIPPLRERIEDIPALLQLFLELASVHVPELHARFVEALLLYRFPKNVRELRRLADWVSTMHPEEPLLRRSHLPDWVLACDAVDAPELAKVCATTTSQQVHTGSGVRKSAIETTHAQSDQDLPRLLTSLQLHRGNVVRAAEAIGLSRHQAYRLIRSSPNISLEEFRRNGQPPARQ